jgi:hypothetical protein
LWGNKQKRSAASRAFEIQVDCCGIFPTSISVVTYYTKGNDTIQGNVLMEKAKFGIMKNALWSEYVFR